MTVPCKTKVEISQTILEHVPKEAEITRIEFEGPALAVYTKRPEILVEQSYIVAGIVNLIRKRIVVRSDPSVRLAEKDAERIIHEIVPREAEITSISFDPSLGEVILDAKKPGLAIGKNGATLQEIVRQTRWRPRILRSPPIPSKIVAHMRHYLHAESKERDRILRTVGERIFRPMVYGAGDIRITALGGFQEVGRSSLLVQTRESHVLLDCGINPGSTNPIEALPRLDAPQFDLDALDAVIISHAHLDHCLHPNAYVQLSSGEVTRICDVPTGEMIPAVNFNDTLQLEDVACIQRGGISAPTVMLEVGTKTKRVKVTPEHPFFTFNGRDIEIKPAKSLKEGDYLSTLRFIDFEGERQRFPEEVAFPSFSDAETCQILGYILGDGGKMGDNYNTVFCTDKNMENLHHYAKLINKKFDLKVKVVKEKRCVLKVHSIKFRRWLEEIEPTLLAKSPLRKIPRCICRVTNDELAAFLKGLFDAEGCIQNHSITLSTSSENIAHTTQLLLIRFGIITHLYDHDEKTSTFGGEKAFHLVIYDPDSIKKFTSKIGFDDKRKMQKLLKMLPKIGHAMAPRMDLLPIRSEIILSIAEKIGLKKNDLRRLGFHYYHYQVKHYPSKRKVSEVVKRLIKIAEKTNNQEALRSLLRLKKITESEIMWEPVTEIREIKADCTHVYDLTILGHSNYIANGLIIHNCGFLPFLFKYGYDGPVYCSAPTLSLMTLLQLDYLDVLNKQGLMPPYDQKDVRESVLHTIPLRYGAVTDIAPDVRLTLHNAGHILGSSIAHLHIGEGLHNTVYTGDYKYAKTMLLEPAVTEFPRVETIITESTYGAPQDEMPSRVEAEEKLASIINETLDRGGKALIPVPAVGRAQEIMLVIDGYMRQGLMKESPVFIEGMISEATAIHTTYPEYLAKEVRNSILHEGINPFQSDYFTIVEHPSAREEIVTGEPSIIIATSGMLEGGPVIDYFRHLSSDERNTIIFVSYQIEGTLGRRVQRGLAETPMINSEGKIGIIKVNLRVDSIEGFSGHSDRRQIINYVRRVTPKPEGIIVCHGEKAKCLSIASVFQRAYKVQARAPEILETFKLR